MNGIGIREGLYTLFFLPLGVPGESAVAMGAVWILIVTSVSALGAFLVSPRLLFKKHDTEPTLSIEQEKNDSYFSDTLSRKSG
jgi:uncharacterized membrane protein YbhN (UPF0104 family)